MHPYIDRLKGLLPRFLKARPAKAMGDRLYHACVTQARQERFYLDYGIEDAIGARFELLTLHVHLVVHALKHTGAEQAKETAQALFDAFLLALDTTLREQGTGDLTVPKKMKYLGTVIYTRMKRWDDLWQAGADIAAQADYAARTLYAGSAFDEAEAASDEAAVAADTLKRAEALVTYVDDTRAGLNIDEILQGRIIWGELSPLDEADQAVTA